MAAKAPASVSKSTSLSTEVERLQASLILAPCCVSDHCHNLALFVAHPDVMLELSFRTCFPQVSHKQTVELLNHPAFLKELDSMVNAQTVTAWPRIMGRMTTRALDGDLAAARFVAEKVGLLKQESSAASVVADELMSRLATAMSESLAKKRQAPIEVTAEVIK